MGSSTYSESDSVRVSHSSKNHHTVPRFYLRAFAEQKKRSKKFFLAAVSKRTGKVLSKNEVANVASENHFNTLTSHPTDPGAFEQELSRIEGALATVYDSGLLGGADANYVSHRQQVASFAALQWLRAKRTRNLLSNHLSAAFRESIARVVTSDLLAEAVEAVELGPVSPDLHAAVILDYHKHVFDLLMARPIVWLDFSHAQAPLITCDEPVSLGSHVGQSYGFANSPLIAMPMGRYHAVVFDEIPASIPQHRIIGGDCDSVHHGAPTLAEDLNSVTADNAMEWVYSHPADMHVARKQVARLRPCRLGHSYRS